MTSVYAWYAGSVACFAYLADLSIVDDVQTGREDPAAPMRHCRSFTRGWTLQEMIAPDSVYFLAADWSCVGWISLHDSPKHTPLGRHPLPKPRSLAIEIEAITNVPRAVLNRHEEARHYSAAQRFSWASQRETTRKEDEAYCLLGLFDISMPLLYGEHTNAFGRLQQEILSRYNDESIFASSRISNSCLLAPEPWDFANAAFVQRTSAAHQKVLFERQYALWRAQPGRSSGNVA